VGSRRTVILLVAIVVAALAGMATYSYTNSADQRANDGARMVSVYMIKKDVPKATPGDKARSGYIASESIPEKLRPATAVTNLDTIKGKVALTDLAANQVLVDGQFVEPRVQQVTTAQQVQTGRVAITVSVDAVKSVAGLIVPGDKVDMLVSDPTGNNGDSERILFQNLEVLAIGSTTAPQPGDTQAVTNPGSNMITFSVPADAAAKIAFVARTRSADIHLALVPPDNKPVNVPPVDSNNLFSGGLTPYEG
jgi:pilus assembly protein CpaB